MTRAFVLASAVLILAAAGCGGGGSKSTATTTVTKVVTATTSSTGSVSVTTHGRYHYPQTVTKNYMQSCENSRVTKAYCACTLDKLSNNVSTQDFARIGLSGGTIPPRIRKLIKRAALDCRNKL